MALDIISYRPDTRYTVRKPRILLFMIVSAACGESDGRDVGPPRDSGARDLGEIADADAGINDDADVGQPDGGDAEPPCRIDWRPPQLPSELTEPFELADVGGVAGWVDMNVHLSFASGSIYPPIDMCPLDNASEFVLTGSGEARDTSALAEIELRFHGYSGPGLYEGVRPGEDRLTMRVHQSNLGTFTSTASTECAICVERDQRAGIFRCIGLVAGGSTMQITTAAFICTP